MKFSTLSSVFVLLLAGNLAAVAKSKTTSPTKILEGEIIEDPYRYNGAVISGLGRGSGFCAWNSKTFFSAAHVVYQGSQWGLPPIWYPSANSAELDKTTAIPSRGYYRWKEYADLAALTPAEDPGQTKYSRDVILAYAFKKLIKGKPAVLNLNGINDLKKKSNTLITGYPGEDMYLGGKIKGFFLHKTGPAITPYEKFAGNALATTFTSSGRGNSGGPVWTLNAKSQWTAAGVLVGGRPSECVVYAFSENTYSLFRAVAPVLKSQIGPPDGNEDVGASSIFFPYNSSTKIPDGRREWTSFRIKVDKFPKGSLVKSAKLSLNIRTAHRGDLVVLLESPNSIPADLRFNDVQNGQGADKKNLVKTDLDVTTSFAGIPANGNWYLRVQDRLKGDVATLKSIVLEISTTDVLTPTTP